MAVAVGALALGAASVGGHDVYCHYVHYDPSVLCERPDGSLWRDPSDGCTGHEDPDCRTTDCPASKRISEGWRHTCSWLFLRAEIGPSGPAPHNEGPSPGRGDPGRLS